MKREYPDGTFYLGDCFDIFPSIPDGSVDMILCDLPYGTTACAWDTILPFEPLWEQYWRVLKPNAAIVLTAAHPFTASLIQSQIQYFKYEWIWVKSKPTMFVHAKNMPMKKHENVLVFSQGSTNHEHLTDRRMPYNPQGLKKIHRPTVKDGVRKNLTGQLRGRPSHGDYIPEWTGYPNSVLEFDSITGWHPTQKPVSLFSYLIRTYTNEGETVLDNTAGAGTTALAARSCNRKWICMEMDPKYFERANESLNVEQLDFE